MFKAVSSKPSKRRKAIYSAPLHRRHVLFSAHLSDELQVKHGRRSFPVRKGDTVKVMRGDYVGTVGKVTRLDLKRIRLFIEGITREKADGTTKPVPIHPSKVVITKLSTDDKWRARRLEEALSQKLEEESGG